MRLRLPRALARRNRRSFLAIEGHTSEAECEWLIETAAALTAGCVVEIGAFRGRSTSALAEGALRNPGRPPVYAIDPHEHFTGALGSRFGPEDRIAFCRNLDRAGLLAVVRLVNLPAAAAGRGFPHDVGLLWIDGDHSEEGVRADFGAFSESLLPGAIVAFHDSLDEALGPARLIRDMVTAGSWRVVARVGTITALRNDTRPA